MVLGGFVKLLQRKDGKEGGGTERDRRESGRQQLHQPALLPNLQDLSEQLRSGKRCDIFGWICSPRLCSRCVQTDVHPADLASHSAGQHVICAADGVVRKYGISASRRREAENRPSVDEESNSSCLVLQFDLCILPRNDGNLIQLEDIIFKTNTSKKSSGQKDCTRIIKEGFLWRSRRIGPRSAAQCMFLIFEQHVAMEQLFQGRPGVLQQDYKLACLQQKNASYDQNQCISNTILATFSLPSDSQDRKSVWNRLYGRAVCDTVAAGVAFHTAVSD